MERDDVSADQSKKLLDEAILKLGLSDDHFINVLFADIGSQPTLKPLRALK
jgi:hypothetical protein